MKKLKNQLNKALDQWEQVKQAQGNLDDSIDNAQQCNIPLKETQLIFNDKSRLYH